MSLSLVYQILSLLSCHFKIKGIPQPSPSLFLLSVEERLNWLDQLSCPVNLTKFANKNDSITGWGAVLSPGDPCEDVKLCGTPVLLNYWPLCLMWGPAAGQAPPSPGDYGLIITQLNDQTVSKPSPARHNFNINLKSQQTKYQVSSLLFLELS